MWLDFGFTDILTMRYYVQMYCATYYMKIFGRVFLSNIKLKFTTRFASHHAAVRTSLVSQLVKSLPTMRETWVQSLGWEDPLEKQKATDAVLWPGESHGLYSPWGHKDSDTTERLSLYSEPGARLSSGLR